jgi:hypothetical protein
MTGFKTAIQVLLICPTHLFGWNKLGYHIITNRHMATLMWCAEAHISREPLGDLNLERKGELTSHRNQVRTLRDIPCDETNILFAMMVRVVGGSTSILSCSSRPRVSFPHKCGFFSNDGDTKACGGKGSLLVDVDVTLEPTTSLITDLVVA